MKVRLHIERLVIEGIDLPSDRVPAFRSALSGELGRLIAERGVDATLHSGGRVPSVTAAAVEVPHGGQSPRRLGEAIARSVHGGLRR